jgi:hypothetical protein
MRLAARVAFLLHVVRFIAVQVADLQSRRISLEICAADDLRRQLSVLRTSAAFCEPQDRCRSGQAFYSFF